MTITVLTNIVLTSVHGHQCGRLLKQSRKSSEPTISDMLQDTDVLISSVKILFTRCIVKLNHVGSRRVRAMLIESAGHIWTGRSSEPTISDMLQDTDIPISLVKILFTRCIVKLNHIGSSRVRAMLLDSAGHIWAGRRTTLFCAYRITSLPQEL